MTAETPPNTASQPTPRVNITTISIDAVLVIVFAGIGYYTHHDTLTLTGLVSTAWPFLAGLLAAHVLLAALRRPAATLISGFVVWIVTVSGGMALRQLTDEGTATAFIVVTTIFNAATLLGWRAGALIANRRKATSTR